MKKIKFDYVNEEVIYEKMSNGLEVYLLPNKNVKNFYITLNTRFGSIHTEFKSGNNTYTKIPNGVAHFLEHLTFKMPDGDASDYYANLGSMSNAYTSFKVTCYEVYAFELFKENLEYLLDFVQTPFYDNKMVEAEKGIITEEVKMYEDDPELRICLEMNKCLFHNDNRRNSISGTVADVKKTTLKNIEDAYNAFYQPSNMFLIITGNFNPDEALAIISENQSRKKFKEVKDIKIKSINEPLEVKTGYKEIKCNNILIPKVNIGLKIPLNSFKTLKLLPIERDIYISVVLNDLFGRSSEIQENLISGNIITDGIILEKYYTSDYLIVNLIVESQYPKRYITLMEEYINNKTINADDLIRKRKVAISNYIQSFDNIEEINASIQSDIINYNELQNNLLEIYQKLDIEIAKKVAKKITTKNSSIVILKGEE